MTFVEFTPYQRAYDGSVGYIISSGQYLKPDMQAQLHSLGVEVVEGPGAEGDCQSWAFTNLGFPELASGKLTLEDLRRNGLYEVQDALPGDLVVYYDHYGIHHDEFHGQRRVISKLGIKGAVCINPWNAFAGSCIPRYFRNQHLPT